MSKIYVFGIGGTGARVLKSLTMLLAAGVKTSATEIIPIIIDADASCGDMTDTVGLMNQYAAIYDTQSHHEGRVIDAFSTKLSKLHLANDYIMPMGGNTNDTFGNYMEFGGLNDENRALVNMLFSNRNQADSMEKGFLGNPNIGSVVLNQFAGSAAFHTFANSFQEGDKIFIISSIFGGTGASGFPLLLKNLRNIAPNLNIPNAAAIRQAEIGAITVLPYFNLEQGTIDSDTFISKTKAALSYYERNLNGLNVLYYIGDNQRGQQENHEGGALQRNAAHFVELAAALSVIDFADNAFAAGTTVYKEFAIDRDTADITLNELNALTTYRQIAKPLTEFTLFSKFLSEKLRDSLTQIWAKPYAEVVGNVTLQMLCSFADSFLQWERGMESGCHGRRFTPFVLDARPEDVFGLVKNHPPRKVRFVSASNWDLYNHYLNEKDTAKIANTHGVNNEGKLIAHLLYGTQTVVDKKINL